MITGKKLGEAVLKVVTEHPSRHSQARWISDGLHSPVDLCHTTACLAGWGVALNAQANESPVAALRRLAGELGVGASWEQVGVRLFSDHEWAEDHEFGTPVYDEQQEEIRAVFYETDDESWAIERLAGALGLEVPKRG